MTGENHGLPSSKSNPPRNLGRGFLVRLSGVTFTPWRYGGRKVLDDVSLQIQPGQFVAVVGPNASGKSTLLRSMAGELCGEGRLEGTVEVANEKIDRPINELVDGVGIVHQFDDSDLIPELSVAENLAIRQILGGGHPGGILAMAAKWRRETAAQLGAHAELIGISLGRIVQGLSGGERQMLSVWIAANFEHHQNPCRLLLLDEHTARLDSSNARKVMDYTDRVVREANATAVMVTHRLSEAVKRVDRLIMIGSGKILNNYERGSIPTPEELVREMEREG
jgi:putative ABC transport system ATP-binding protein